MQSFRAPLVRAPFLAFPRYSILAALGQAVPTDEFEAMHALASLTGLAVPQSLAALRDKPVRFESVIEKDDVAQAARML